MTPDALCVDCERFECFGVEEWNIVMDTAVPHTAAKPSATPATSKDSAFRAFLSGRSGWEPGAPRHTAYRRMVLHGIPSHMRRDLWPRFLGIDRVKRAYSSALWDRVKQGHDVDPDTASRIERDLHRTFPSDAFLQAPGGTQMLRNVLLACASFDPKLGYTQGMAFAAGIFLLHGIPEEDAFWCMVSLASSECYGMRAIWAPELDDNKMWAKRREAIWAGVVQRMPGFLAWCGDDTELPDMLILPFLPSLFCNRLPQDAAARALDVFFLVGWDAISVLMTAILFQAWQRVDQNAIIDPQLVAPTILPVMFNECRNNPQDIATSAWRELLPAPTSPTYIPPPTSPVLLKDESLYKHYIVI
eukprot:TRINITY_DN59297_c0_g1_i1.p1 TRINITY_DN59297_c0_g1~~TRINITY_DN59297_c0_g1_i1.p1  ORF type:complete len:359 (+),score=102.23 TRINITY_DN59297_c0_g1_i1:72-1148(+)